ncbi:hypothetical protein BGY98DRAFT_937295 [Russula aff. rugulosa BPL654]|nr:hypothetical protein BGY98DRAFT_937295 [Russula aff. rugulosa BPL654]
MSPSGASVCGSSVEVSQWTTLSMSSSAFPKSALDTERRRVAMVTNTSGVSADIVVEIYSTTTLVAYGGWIVLKRIRFVRVKLSPTPHRLTCHLLQFWLSSTMNDYMP